MKKYFYCSCYAMVNEEREVPYKKIDLFFLVVAFIVPYLLANVCLIVYRQCAHVYCPESR